MLHRCLLTFILILLLRRIEGIPTGRPRLPANTEFNNRPLIDLVKYRPRKIDSEEGRQYKQKFSQHPQVTQISLHNPNRADTIQKLLELKKDAPTGLKRRLTMSIRNHIEDSYLDDGLHKIRLMGELDGTRVQQLKKNKRQRYKDKVGVKELTRQKYLYEHKFKQQNGLDYQTYRRGIRKQKPLLNKPLAFHFDRMGLNVLTALQAECEARHLSELYPSKARLTIELEKYLRKSTFPADQQAAALAARSSRLNADAKARRVKGGKGALTAVTNDQATTSASTSTSQLKQGVSPAQTLQGIHNDPNDPLDWSLLKEFLNS